VRNGDARRPSNSSVASRVVLTDRDACSLPFSRFYSRAYRACEVAAVRAHDKSADEADPLTTAGSDHP
jgi:hypothetical protein